MADSCDQIIGGQPFRYGDHWQQRWHSGNDLREAEFQIM
jgi:hypothetical protein